MRCVFVYGVVDAGEWTDGGADLRTALGAAPGVEPDGPPQVLTCGRLGVLHSAVPLADYSGAQFDAHLEDVEWLAPRARAHAQVVSLAFARQAVLPMRFGALFSGSESLQAAFTARQPELLDDLAAGGGQEEWTVRLCANPDALAERAAAQAMTGAGGQGAQYLLRRRTALTGRESITAALLDRAEAAHTALAVHALQVTDARTELSGLPGGARSMLSRIYRIAQAQRDQFLQELERLAAELAAEGLTVLQSGPWPAARADAAG